MLDIHNLINQAARNMQVQHGSAKDGQSQACRIHGSLNVNKVMGMLHFTAPGHGYMGKHVPHEAMNFTHRIDKLSFGHHYPGLTNPLDRTVEYANTKMTMFQYFVAVVPTIYIDKRRTFGHKVLLTHQYAVTDYSRSVDMGQGGLPGVFRKRDDSNGHGVILVPSLMPYVIKRNLHEI
ncbi:hypothetical protein HK104_000650 [Borealophlyctis nickersoniae]|nr:hypothetical protein HK104_000650 [Borealophlyctis nickersoniae]